MTYYLKFESEEAAQRLLSDYYDGERWITEGLTHALDPVGTIYNNDAVISEDMTVLVEPTAVEGWHVNFIGDLPTNLGSYLIFPNTPSRIFAV